MKKENLFILIAARKGSKRIKNKNFKLLNKKPLIEYTFAFIKRNLKKKIFLSTDYDVSDEMIKKYEIEIIKRPKKLCKSDSNSIDVIKHSLKKIPCDGEDIIIFLQPTVPLRSPKLLIDGINLLKENNKLQSCSSYILNEFYQTKALATKIGKNKMINLVNPKSGQFNKKIYTLDGSFYLFRKKLVETKNTLIDKDHVGIINKFECHVNIDNQNDWDLAEILVKRYKAMNFVD